MNTDQMAELRKMRTTGVLPAIVLDASRRLLRYESNPLGCPLSGEQKALYEKTGQLDVENVGDIVSADVTIGCPMLLRPPLVKALWNRTIDWALERELLKPEA